MEWDPSERHPIFAGNAEHAKVLRNMQARRTRFVAQLRSERRRRNSNASDGRANDTMQRPASDWRVSDECADAVDASLLLGEAASSRQELSVRAWSVLWVLCVCALCCVCGALLRRYSRRKPYRRIPDAPAAKRTMRSSNVRLASYQNDDI